jgi:hypothetical protein
MPKHPTGPTAKAHVKPDATEEPRASKQQPPAGVQPVEAEDAQLTGSTHPQQQEELQKNVPHKEKSSGHQAERRPDMPAGIHATGSFTEKD